MEPLENLRKVRLEKLEKLKKLGIDPYPAKFAKTQKISELKDLKLGTKISVSGRLMAIRAHGGSTFCDLEDQSGKIQAWFKKNEVGESYEILNFLDLGDFIGIFGSLVKTKAGELTIDTSSFALLTKSLRSLPSSWYGLKDVEARYRLRYLDLILNSDIKDIFTAKTAFWDNVREFLKNNEFFEVETPVLEAIPGGADARPFVTHHNVLKIDLYLRISLELHLKRLIVGGYEKVFEIGRVFRNEGIDAEHLQDYTQMEFYWAYSSYEELMEFTQTLYQSVIKKTFGSLTTGRNNQKIDWSGNWPKVEYATIFKEKTGIDLLSNPPISALQKKAQDLSLNPPASYGKGRIIDLIYKKLVRPNFIQPTFLINHPVDVSPLAKRIPEKPNLAQRMQIMAGGTELGNGFSELNDPIDQKKRFEEQSRLRAQGDDEAQMMDEDFVRALEYGMPPTAGFGMSERLFAFLVDKPMREVVFFPTLKPEKRKEDS